MILMKIRLPVGQPFALGRRLQYSSTVVPAAHALHSAVSTRQQPGGWTIWEKKNGEMITTRTLLYGIVFSYGKFDMHLPDSENDK